MNGAALVLSLAGALAAAGAGRRGARLLDLSPRRRAEFDGLADEFRLAVNGREGTRKEEKAFARRHGLVPLGRGYARAVFRVPEGALKIEMGWRPFADNRAEADLWAQAPTDLAEHLVPVLAHAHDYGWLLMPEVEVGGDVSLAAQGVLEGCGLGDFMRHETNIAKDGRLVDYAFVTQEAWRRACMKRGREQRDPGHRARQAQQDDQLLRQLGEGSASRAPRKGPVPAAVFREAARASARFRKMISTWNEAKDEDFELNWNEMEIEETFGDRVLGYGNFRLALASKDPRFVIKLSMRPSDNLDEAAAWLDAGPRTRTMLVPVVAYDPEGHWLVMERVTPYPWGEPESEGLKALRQSARRVGLLDVHPDNVSTDLRLLDYAEPVSLKGSPARRGSRKVIKP